MDEPKTVTNHALDRLPLFASDLEIAVAIVGKKYASLWKRDVIPVLESKGFPRWDPLHQGRPVPHVRQFYALYLGITAGFTIAPSPESQEREWVPKREKAAELPENDGRLTAAQRKARAKANAEAWAEKKRKALEDHRAKNAATDRASSPSASSARGS